MTKCTGNDNIMYYSRSTCYLTYSKMYWCGLLSYRFPRMSIDFHLRWQIFWFAWCSKGFTDFHRSVMTCVGTRTWILLFYHMICFLNVSNEIRFKEGFRTQLCFLGGVTSALYPPRLGGGGGGQGGMHKIKPRVKSFNGALSRSPITCNELTLKSPYYMKKKGQLCGWSEV